MAGYEALSRFAGPPDATPDVWFEAAGRLGLGAELDVVVVLETVVARVMARPAADRFDPLVCVDDRGHYLGVLRIEQLVHWLMAGPRP